MDDGDDPDVAPGAQPGVETDERGMGEFVLEQNVDGSVESVEQPCRKAIEQSASVIAPREFDHVDVITPLAQSPDEFPVVPESAGVGVEVAVAHEADVHDFVSALTPSPRRRPTRRRPRGW
jgi:hypothetical protein